jgi:hypothetical protein
MRDLRPTVFIKDLNKRAAILEEEKAEHRSLKKKAKQTEKSVGDLPEAAPPKEDEKLAVHFKSLNESMASKDAAKLKEAVYQAKMVSLETECSETSFAKLQSLIQSAEEDLLNMATKLQTD